jgi:energy-coupling factor transporter ATP-binding protein EcfA2
MDIKQLIPDDDVNELINDELQTTNTSLSDEVQLKDEGKGLVKLPAGVALTKAETYNIIASEDTKLIIFLGPNACGKTTIETTIYQLFQRDSIGDIFFAGSKTVYGYEQRSFYTRMRSKQNTSSTLRTSRSVQETFLHLKTWNSKNNTYQNFLFADLSGEIFADYITNTKAMQNDLDFFKSADFLVAVLDGKLISDKKERNGTFEEIAEILRTVYDAHLISRNTKLQVVISKYDILPKDNADNTEFINRIKDELQQRLKNYCSSIEFFHVAAMPENISNYEVGYGISHLLNSWMATDINNKLEFKFTKKPKVKSEFNQHYRKILGDIYE